MHASVRSNDLEVQNLTHTTELDKFKKKTIKSAGQYHVCKFKTHSRQRQIQIQGIDAQQRQEEREQGRKENKCESLKKFFKRRPCLD